MVISINFFSGPSGGKSTLAAATFSKLKFMGINCELITEYAKTKVWEQSFHTLTNQIYVFGKQHHRMFTVKDKVDILITDSPLPLSLIYGKNMSSAFETLVLEEFHKFNNINIFLKRQKRYQPVGRIHSEEESKEIDCLVKSLLDKYNIQYTEVEATPLAPDTILTLISEKLINK